EAPAPTVLASVRPPCRDDLRIFGGTPLFPFASRRPGITLVTFKRLRAEAFCRFSDRTVSLRAAHCARSVLRSLRCESHAPMARLTNVSGPRNLLLPRRT